MKTLAGTHVSVSRYVELERWGYTAEAIAFLGLSTAPGVGFSTLRNVGGPAGYAELLNTNRTLDVADLSRRKAPPARLPSAALKSRGTSKELWKQGVSLARELIRQRIRFLTSAELPAAFRQLPATMQPGWLFVQGELALLHEKSIAVVGTRHPTHTGEFLTRYVVGGIGTLNTPVVSGLAYGIDTIAHESCLEIDLPTISVLGGGLLALYPAKNGQLAERIVRQGGALLTEYLPTQHPTAATFVLRNRLQASLASAVVATEWKKSSGTAHTIRFASQFERLSISVRLSRTTPRPDAGIAQVNLDVPRQHDALMQALHDSLHRPPLHPLIPS